MSEYFVKSVRTDEGNYILEVTEAQKRQIEHALQRQDKGREASRISMQKKRSQIKKSPSVAPINNTHTI